MNREQNNIYHLIKNIVFYAYIDNIEMKQFILTLFHSEYIYSIINFYDVIYYNPSKIYHDLIKGHNFSKVINDKEYDIIVLNYICYIYLVFHFRTKESFDLITKQLTFDEIINYYEYFHTIADERVIFKAKINCNLKMNYIRKNRATGYNFDLSNDKRNLFIAKYIYLKLFNYPEIKELKYEYHNGLCYLKSDQTTLFVSDYSHVNQTIDSSEASFIKYNSPNNILVIFLKKNENITKTQLEDLFHSQPQIPFDKILIYKDEKVDFINNGDGYNSFYIFITSLDLKKINKDYSSLITK